MKKTTKMRDSKRIKGLSKVDYLINQINTIGDNRPNKLIFNETKTVRRKS